MVNKTVIWNDNQHTDNYELAFDFEDDKKPEKIVLSNRDDDRGYDNPKRWEFEIVDKKYIDDANANLQTQITTNSQNIQNNTNNISNNASNIAANSTQLADHENRITNNTNAITTINNTLAHLTPTGATPIFDKVYSHKNTNQYFRYHSFISELTDTKLTMAVEIYFHSNDDVFSKVDLWKILPWVSWDGATGNPVIIPVNGKNVQINQTPTISDIFAMFYDAGSGNIAKSDDLSLLRINVNSTTEYPKMYISVSYLNPKHIVMSGRIFGILTFNVS